MSDLVARLRAEDPETGLRWSIASEAADRIEQLEAALREVIELSRMRSPHAWSSEADYFRIARTALEGKE